MNFYRLSHLEKNAVCEYSSSNSAPFLSALSEYDILEPSNREIKDWKGINFTLKGSRNKRKKTDHIMHFDLRFFIADKYAKEKLESRFSDCLQFLRAVNDDDPSAEYYFLYPYVCIDGLDMERSKCNLIMGEYHTTIYEYYLKDDVEYCPVFKLILNKGIVDTARVYATDEFKDFVEENNITGFEFDKVFSRDEPEADNSSEKTAATDEVVMNYYEVLSPERRIVCEYSPSNPLPFLDALDEYRMADPSNRQVKNWKELHFTLKEEGKKIKDINNTIMRFDLNFFIADKIAKEKLENRFSDCIQFLRVINDDDPFKEYYFVYPYICIDALDTERSECCWHTIRGKQFYSEIYKYYLKDDVEYCPVFKLANGNMVRTSCMYVTDEFKNFVEENNITGLEFKKIFPHNESTADTAENVPENKTASANEIMSATRRKKLWNFIQYP